MEFVIIEQHKGKNFFRQLRDAKNYITLEKVECSDFEVGVLDQLIEFVESGSIFSSEVGKFICKNWKLSTPELTQLWNNSTGSSKSSDTMRCQVNVISHNLQTLFGLDIINLFNGHNEEFVKDFSNTLSVIINYYDYDMDSSTYTLFSKEVNSYCGSDDCEHFDLGVCKDEIRVLKSIMNSSIYNLLDECNTEKVGYLLNVLSKPLVKKQKGTRDIVLNNEKVQLLKELDLVEPLELSVERNVSDKSIVPNEMQTSSVLSNEELISQLESRATIDDNTNKLPQSVISLIGRLLTDRTFIQNISGKDAKDLLEVLK